MSDQTEKQASQEPFDDKNLGELFQIALVNAPSPSRSAFNWGASVFGFRTAERRDISADC